MSSNLYRKSNISKLISTLIGFPTVYSYLKRISMVQQPSRNPKAKSSKSKTRTQEHIVQFKAVLAEAKVKFMEKMSANVIDVGDVKSFELLETIGSGAFGVVMVAKNINNNQLYALKLIEKKVTVLQSQVAHVKNEVKILSCTDFEFLIRMEFFFKDNVYLYIGMPFVNGGELTTHLSRLKKFDERLSRFYGAQVILALQYLHHMGIIYRDLKPENVCISADGYIRICDFGFSKKIDDGRTYSFCGTPDYLAPEIILHIGGLYSPLGFNHLKLLNVCSTAGYSFSVDFWTLGVFLYEISAGFAPFTDENAAIQYDKIVKGKFQCPPTFTKELTDLVHKLIVVDRSSRYGCLKNGYGDIKLHDWFDDTDWSGIYGKKVRPTLLPKIDSEHMGSNFFQQSNLELRKCSVDEYSYLFTDFN